MLADLSAVAGSLREDTFAAKLSRLREEIQRQLRQTGSYKIREAGREFIITIRIPPDSLHAAPSVEGEPSDSPEAPRR
jgi:hypothetical protein